ncbi:DUF736 family protein [Rhizobium beringeri]|uniref:DUF736 family protein n=1 Tax=Rhizobium beringeri TaxID=3019934 RepID=UPI003B58E5A6
MTELANFIRFNEDGTISGNIASIAYDIDIAGEPFSSTNKDAPVFRISAKSPRGRRVELGGIWKKKNQNGGDYFSLFGQHRPRQAKCQSRSLSRSGRRGPDGRRRCCADHPATDIGLWFSVS